MKNFVFMVVLFMLCGCTVVYKMPDTPPAPTQTPVSNPPQTVAPPPAPVQRPTPAPKISTISESVQLCQDIQRASNITIGCEFKYIVGTPTMYLLFPDYTTASNSWQILTESLAAPFCIDANSANRQAQLVLYVSNPKMARIYFCEANLWTEWVNYGDNKGSRGTNY